MKNKSNIEPIDRDELTEPKGHYSNCCGILTFMWEYGICPFCKEHCTFEDRYGNELEHDVPLSLYRSNRS